MAQLRDGSGALPLQTVVRVVCVSRRRYASGSVQLGRTSLALDLHLFLQNHPESILFSEEQNIPKSKPKPLRFTGLTASSKFSKSSSMVRCHSHRDEVSSSFPSLWYFGGQRAIFNLASA